MDDIYVGDASRPSEPAHEIINSGTGPALRIRQEGSGNAIEIVGPGGQLWWVGRDGTPSAIGVGSGSLYEFKLSGTHAAGSTTLTFTRAATPIVASRNLLAIIDPFTVKAEVRELAALSGSTVTIGVATGTSPLDFAHADGATVLIVGDDRIGAAVWGALGANDNTQDDWGAIQAGIIQAQKNAVWLVGQGIKHVVTKPLVMPTGTRLHGFTIKAHPTLYTASDTDNAGMFSSLRETVRIVSADAVTDTITTDAAHGLSVSSRVSFSNPTGETLPGGLVTGRVYHVLTVPTSTTFTISATNGGPTFDITSTGTGYVHGSSYSLERVFLDDIYYAGNGVAKNGVWLALQQPAWTRNLRVDGCTQRAIIVQGQISNHFSMEVVVDQPNAVGLTVLETGHEVHGLNVTRTASSGQTGVSFGVGTPLYVGGNTYSFDNNIFGCWTEAMDTHLRFAGPALGIGVYGWNPSISIGQTGIQVDAAVGAVNRSYTVTGGRVADSNATIMNDDTRTASFLASRMPASTNVRIEQQAGNVRAAIYDLSSSGSLNFGSIAANSVSSELTISVPGATVGDIVSVGVGDALEAGLVLASARVSAANTVALALANVTAVPIDPAAHTFTVSVKGVV